MLTLDATVAEYQRARNTYAAAVKDASHRGSEQAVMASYALDAAVCNVALAAIDSLKFLNIEGCGDCQDTACLDARAEIKRCFGPEKAGE